MNNKGFAITTILYSLLILFLMLFLTLLAILSQYKSNLEALIEENNGARDIVSNRFATDSWDTIISNIKKGNSDMYNVGDTKCIKLTGFTTENDNGCSNGEFAVRLANNSTPDECKNSEFSQSACGFVIEFVDIIDKKNMKGTDADDDTVNTTVDGWSNRNISTYINDTIYNALPSDLKSNILVTTVISGHGVKDESNFTTEDRLYLLSSHEVWDDDDGDKAAGIDAHDTAYDNTRQLDYYKNNNVTTSNYASAIKKYEGKADKWWLRTANSDENTSFLRVNDNGKWGDCNINLYTRGIAPAFRIG